MTIALDPSLVELLSSLEKLKARLKALDPSSATVTWLGDLDKIASSLKGVRTGIAKLKGVMIADAMSEGAEGMDPEGSDDQQERAKVYAAAQSATFNEMFGAWPQKVAQLVSAISGSDVAVSTASSKTKELVTEMETYVKSEKGAALKNNPWGVETGVGALETQLGQLKAKIS